LCCPLRTQKPEIDGKTPLSSRIASAGLLGELRHSELMAHPVWVRRPAGNGHVLIAPVIASVAVCLCQRATGVGIGSNAGFGTNLFLE
jgi:hypothetical protein